MISVIVSSHKEIDFFGFSQSLFETIGVPYELIKIENPGQFSISKAYNLGAEKAKFEYLIFVHEDVVFVTPGWGIKHMNLYKTHPELGIVGVAGSMKKSSLPTGWGTGTGEFDRIHLIQIHNKKEEFQSTGKSTDRFEVVRVLDGVFLSTTKEIWSNFRFDENLQGYHLYDIDFSLRVSQKWKAIISYEILLKHFSSGNYNSDWVDKTLEYHQDKVKSSLFDQHFELVSKSRRAWYKALAFGNINSSLRKKYLSRMGFDFFSSIHAFAFRFPWFGKKIFKLIEIVGL